MRRFSVFWERWGYVCVLACCAALIGTTAVLTRPPKAQPEAPQVTRYADAAPSATPAPAAVQAAVQTTPQPLTFLIPCEGSIGMGFSQEATVYNQTLAEYAVHEGVDILAKEGAAVRAMADGTVTRVWLDALMGHCLQITHRSGYISTYCSLYSPGVVQEGTAVSRGQVIGTAGTSALAECAEGPHVHVELRRTRKLMDPESFFEDSLD